MARAKTCPNGRHFSISWTTVPQHSAPYGVGGPVRDAYGGECRGGAASWPDYRSGAGGDMAEATAGGRDQIGRASRASRRRGESTAVVEQPAWRQPRSPYAPTDAVSADELEAIHEASLKVLEEIGLDILSAEAKSILKEAGADVAADGDRVRFDRGLVEQVIGKPPAEFTLHARNPDAFAAGSAAPGSPFCAVASAPNAHDMDGGRRPGNSTDFLNLVKLIQQLTSSSISSAAIRWSRWTAIPRSGIWNACRIS